MSFELAISPAGHLFVETGVAELDFSARETAERAFASSRAHGLELLGGKLLQTPLSPSAAYWREFARKFFTALCHCPQFGVDSAQGLAVPGGEELAIFIESAPPMKGIEFLTPGLLATIWAELETHARTAIQERRGTAAEYLQTLNPVWNAVGRVTFHLAENKRNAECPFAFLATYTHAVSEKGSARHLPLGRALQEYAGTQNRAALASLLAPVQKAAERSKLARELLDSRSIFHPQTWRPDQAYRFLQEAPILEESGVSVRIPDWWKAGRPPRPKVTVRIGEQPAGTLGRDALLDFKVEVSLDGETLSADEWKEILRSSDGLALIKGKWVEVNREQLREVLDHWKKLEAQTALDGVPLLEGLRLLSGYNPGSAGDAGGQTAAADWTSFVAGDWLEKTLQEIRDPRATGESDPGAELHAELRPYQRQGVHWLWFMSRLGLGMCLADDMGLGKTIQVISLLLLSRREARAAGAQAPALLVVPASLLGNWKAELQRFAPSLQAVFAHPSESSAESLRSLAAAPEKQLEKKDLVITTYSMLARTPWLNQVKWNYVILDEAQAIKNPAARQTRAVKALPARCRLALTGTPIENRLSDLWSLFDFICPGLLGGAKQFSAFVKSRAESPGQFAPLRKLVRPYILRRLKTDKRVISDLPEKTELLAFCHLSKAQAVLYKKSVDELEEQLENGIDGIKRRGVILAFLTRFKQICNHPSQWLSDGAFRPEDSGKFQRLRELAEEIHERQEKLLAFTQYREMTEPLARYLATIFGRNGLILHGGTPVSRRRELVESFQDADGPPFFVLSLKAGGTGLNLTAASHVIHFDRWWNPAVENQATDRAFRIGQKRNVIVQKFLCRGTLEERINELITAKKELADDLLSEGAEKLLTEMSNSQLLSFVRLDMNSVADE